MALTTLSDLFDVTYGNKFDLNKMTLLNRSEGGVNFVGRSSENHGVSATVAPLSGVVPYPAGLITVALGGTKLLSSFVQEHQFYTAQNVAVLREKKPMTFAQKLYICSCIRHNRFRYSAFGREANRTIKKMRIPALADAPNWLSEAVHEAQEPLLATMSKLDALPSKPRAGATEAVGSKMVPIAELFDVIYGTNLELNRLVRDPQGINFVSRTAKRNGVSARVRAVKGLPPIQGGVLSVAGGGSVLETFLQLEPFYSGRDLLYLRPKQPLTPEELLFYCSCIRANKFKFSYGRQANRTLPQLEIPAPESIPNWVYGGLSRATGDVKPLILAGGDSAPS